ncbi:MAG: hypothetical protein OEV58_13475 [Gammaproteobacteria bacterium]|nr:hypothetical protein [Gammaproteobacteria bacterium]MDH5262658.1 hypothetical protein [Gammaproteobacteria bacterium]
MKSKLIHALLLTALPTGIALGAPAGELDPAFGDHGRVLLRDAPFEEFAGVVVFVDPSSGKLTLVADGYPSDRLLRFNSDGSLDADFGAEGSALLDFGGDDLNISDVEWLADGKLLIAGALNVYGTPDNILHGSALLARMHADGTPDLSFGNSGRATLELGGVFESISEILLQPGGRIVVFGYTNRTGSDERVLARFTPDGLPDSSFGNSATPGISVINMLGVDARLADVVQQSDGKFLFCGDAKLDPAAPDRNNIVAVRVHAGGAPDLTFGNNGMLLIGGWQDSVAVNTCRELGDGHVIFVGSEGSDDRQRAAAWRMTPDGRLDTGFGIGGMQVLDTDTPSTATAMLIMSDSSVAIAGSQWQPDTQWRGDNNAWLWWSDMLVARFDPTSGEVDLGFGDRGVTVVDFGAHEFASNAYSANLAQQADGKLLIVGAQVDEYDWYPWYSIALARVDPYGSGSNGVVSVIDTTVSAPAAGGELELRLRRTGGSTGSLAVDYTTVAGTAIAGTDFVATNGTVMWSDGDMDEKTISITMLNSAQPGDSKTFRIALSNSNGGLGMSQATIYIPRSNAPGGSGSNVPVSPGTSNGGGGAIGLELLFLMALVAFGVTPTRPHSVPTPSHRHPGRQQHP